VSDNDKLTLRLPVLPLNRAQGPHGNIYPQGMMVDEVDRLQQLIHDRKFLATFGRQDSSVRLTDTAGVVTEMTIQDDCIYAEIELLPTPKGQVIHDLFAKGEVEFKPYGVGTLEGDTVSDYRMTAVAIVPKSSES